jgi:hypothetical protein
MSAGVRTSPRASASPRAILDRFSWLRVEIMDDRGEFFRGEAFAGGTAYTSARCETVFTAGHS